METSNRVLDALLKELDLPHVEERVPRDVFYELGLKFPQQYAVAARDVAGRITADGDVVLGRRREAVVRVEARHLLDAVERGLRLLGEAAEHLFGQPAVLGLEVVELREEIHGPRA